MKIQYYTPVENGCWTKFKRIIKVKKRSITKWLRSSQYHSIHCKNNVEYDVLNGKRNSCSFEGYYKV